MTLDLFKNYDFSYEGRIYTFMILRTIANDYQVRLKRVKSGIFWSFFNRLFGRYDSSLEFFLSPDCYNQWIGDNNLPIKELIFESETMELILYKIDNVLA